MGLSVFFINLGLSVCIFLLHTELGLLANFQFDFNFVIFDSLFANYSAVCTFHEYLGCTNNSGIFQLILLVMLVVSSLFIVVNFILFSKLDIPRQKVVNKKYRKFSRIIEVKSEALTAFVGISIFILFPVVVKTDNHLISVFDFSIEYFRNYWFLINGIAISFASLSFSTLLVELKGLMKE